MKAIVTVTGIDHTGIIAAVTTALAELHVNIVNVSQTLMGEYFTMIMECVLDDDSSGLADVQESLRKVGVANGIVVRIQSEAIFDAMHRL